MKKTSVIIVLFLILSHQLKAFENNSLICENKENNFKQMLGGSLVKLKKAKINSDFLTVVNELKRLDQLFPNEWLADYYISLIDLQLSFLAAADTKENLLKEAHSKIEDLKQNTSANTSEVFTLEGYYYFALIAQDPALNGQTYYKEVIASYSKAIAYNKTNPRPVLLLSLFKDRMAKFTGDKQNSLCEKLKKIELLFADFTAQHEFDPTWGIKQLQIAQEKCEQINK